MVSISGVAAISRLRRVLTVWRSSSSPVLDVAPVFPEVDDDAVGSGQLRQGRGRHRVRLIGEAGLAQGSHMINVYFQSRHADFS